MTRKIWDILDQDPHFPNVSANKDAALRIEDTDFCSDIDGSTDVLASLENMLAKPASESIVVAGILDGVQKIDSYNTITEMVAGVATAYCGFPDCHAQKPYSGPSPKSLGILPNSGDEKLDAEIFAVFSAVAFASEAYWTDYIGNGRRRLRIRLKDVLRVIGSDAVGAVVGYVTGGPINAAIKGGYLP